MDHPRIVDPRDDGSGDGRPRRCPAGTGGGRKGGGRLSGHARTNEAGDMVPRDVTERVT